MTASLSDLLKWCFYAWLAGYLNGYVMHVVRVKWEQWTS